MIRFGLWLLATAVYGWLCGVLGRQADPVRCALALVAWLGAWGGWLLYRDLGRVSK